jgi:hypothetical protein
MRQAKPRMRRENGLSGRPEKRATTILLREVATIERRTADSTSIYAALYDQNRNVVGL